MFALSSNRSPYSTLSRKKHWSIEIKRVEYEFYKKGPCHIPLYCYLFCNRYNLPILIQCKKRRTECGGKTETYITITLMRNYFRAVKLSFKYKSLIIQAVIYAFLVGILWGGNIGAIVYPITEICLKKETFSSWLDKTIQNCENKIAEFENVSRGEGDPTQVARLKNNLSWYQWVKPKVERYTPKKPFQTVLFLILIVLVGTVIKIVFIVAHSITSAAIAQQTAYELREIFFRKVLDYEVNFYSREGISDMMSRFTNDMTILTHGINILYGKIIREPLKMFVCLALAAYISWALLLVTLLLVPAAAVSIRWLAKSLKRVVRRAMEEMAVMYGRLEETFRSIRIIKAFNRENYEQTKFQQTNKAYLNKAMRIAKYDALANPMTELFGILMISVAVIAGSYIVMREKTSLLGMPVAENPLDMGMLTAFFFLLAGAADPARKLSDIFTAFQSSAAAADRIFHLIDREISITEPSNPKELRKHEKAIRFDNVSFAYDPTRPVLKNVTLEIPFGQCVAILGPSGCGKSTLVNLIPRFSDPTSGQVLVDDIPINELTFRSLRRQIGYVSQEPILFNDTVLNNIHYGNRKAGREEIIDAAQKANAHEFIEREIQNGYETVVGPSGGQLSGGQRQRIALSRAILRDPTIFLLDEATSQIDLNSEKMIHEALATFKQGRTTIMVTHRLSALILADRILVMENGQIVADGTHETLLKESPFYAKLYEKE